MRFNLLLLMTFIALTTWSREVVYNKVSYMTDEETRTCKTKPGYEYDFKIYPGSKVSGSVQIPPEIKIGENEYTVTEIADMSFGGSKNLTEVIIPSTVSTIGLKAFSECPNLVNVSFETGSKLRKIGTSAFLECPALTSIKIPFGVDSIAAVAFSRCTSLATVDIPKSVSFIGSDAFSYCSALTSIELPNIPAIETGTFTWCPFQHIDIPNSVKSIGTGAFASCSGLRSIRFGNSIEDIYRNAFAWCTNLQEIELPESLGTIGEGAFQGSGLTSIKMPNGVKSIGKAAFKKCKFLKHVDMGKSIISRIENETFYDCPSLNTVVFGKSLETIGYNAFGSCRELNTIDLPNSLVSIEDYAFGYGLASLHIPGNVKNIGRSAFGGYYTSVTVPASVTSIGVEAFSSENLQEINVETGNENYASIDGCLFNKDITCIYRYPRKKSGSGYEIPNTVQSIEDYSFSGCNLSEVILPEYVSHIGEWAFASSDLKSIAIPDNVISIGDNAFSQCGYLSSASVGNSVAHIGSNSFYSCNRLTSVLLGNSLTNIGAYAFYNCPIESIVIPNSVINIGPSAFNDCGHLGSLVLGSGVETIGESAFNECCNLEKVIIPSSVKTIDKNAFNSAGIHELVIGAGVQLIDEMAFGNNPNLTQIHITADVPPTASENSFQSYETTALHVGQNYMETYSHTTPWCNFTNIEADYTPAQYITLDKAIVSAKPGEKFNLTATIYPVDVTLNTILWESSDDSVAKVDNFGIVTITTQKPFSISDSRKSCEIKAYTLYSDSPIATCEINIDTDTEIEDITNNCLGGNDNSNATEIFNLQGVKISSTIKNLSSGMYIVREGRNTRKIFIK